MRAMPHEHLHVHVHVVPLPGLEPGHVLQSNRTSVHVHEKSGGPEQKEILWTAVSSLLALINTIYSGIHAGLYTQRFLSTCGSTKETYMYMYMCMSKPIHILVKVHV